MAADMMSINTKSVNAADNEGYVYMNGKRYKKIYSDGSKVYLMDAPDTSQQERLDKTLETVNKGNEAVYKLLHTIKMYENRL